MQEEEDEEESEFLVRKEERQTKEEESSSWLLLVALERWRLTTIVGIVCLWYGVVVVWELKARPYWFQEVSATRRAILDILVYAPWGLRLVVSECGLVGHFALLGSECAALIAFVIAGLGNHMSQLTGAGVLAIVQAATVVHLVTANRLVSEAVRTSRDPRALTSIFWMIAKPFELATLALSGSLLEFTPVRRSYMPGLAIASLIVALVVAFGRVLFSAEKGQSRQQRRSTKLLILGVGLGLASSCIASLALSTSLKQWHRLSIAAIGVAVCGLAPLFYVLDYELAAIGAFFILRACCTLDLRGATFLFYTEPLPGFPRLDEFFVSTVLGYVSEFCALAGVLTYKNCLTEWQTRKVFQLVAALTCITNVSAIPLIYWRIFAFSPVLDKLAILFEEAIAVVVLNLNDVPLTLLVATRCESGQDAMIFALLGSTRHFANQFSPYAGNFLLNIVGANASDKPLSHGHADADALNRLWIAKFVVALVVLIPAYSPLIRLIPANDIGGTAPNVLPSAREEEIKEEGENPSRQSHEEPSNPQIELRIVPHKD